MDVEAVCPGWGIAQSGSPDDLLVTGGGANNNPPLVERHVPAYPSFKAARAVSIARYAWRCDGWEEGYDATKNLPEGEPTRVLPKGTKTGLPKRRSVFDALDKISKKPAN